MAQVLEQLRAIQGLLAASLWRQVLVAIIILLVFLLIRNLLVRFVFKTIIKLFQPTETGLNAYLLGALEKPVKIFFIVLGAFFAFFVLPLTPYQDLLLARFFRTFIIILIAWCFYNLTSHAIIDEIGKIFDIKIDEILFPFIRKILKFLILVLALTIIAQEWAYDISGFIAGLGLGGLAVAFAAKDAIANIFGGVVIITEKPFTIGNWIYTPSVEGTVEEISFRSTRVRTFANALVTVPNSVLANEPITNWSRMKKRRVSFHLEVRYDTSQDKLKKCLLRIRGMLENNPAVHPETIFVSFDGFENDGLAILIYFFTRATERGKYLSVKEEINFKILDILGEEGVSVVLPSRSIYLETLMPQGTRNGLQGTGNKIKGEGQDTGREDKG